MQIVGDKIEVIDKENLEVVWELVYELVKVVTGNVDIKVDGDLQNQIKNIAKSTNRIRDDTTNKEYKIGIDNGVAYIQEVKE